MIPSALVCLLMIMNSEVWSERKNEFVSDYTRHITVPHIITPCLNSTQLYGKVRFLSQHQEPIKISKLVYGSRAGCGMRVKLAAFWKPVQKSINKRSLFDTEKICMDFRCFNKRRLLCTVKK